MAFLRSHAGLGSTVVTDARPVYPAALRRVRLTHGVRNVSASGLSTHVALPGVHRLFSLVKRVLDGTYHGSAQPEHLRPYLNEFAFRFNRRRSNRRGMLFFLLLEASVAGSPAQYKDLAVIHRQPKIVSMPPSTPRQLPRTLAGEPLERPSRAA